MYEIKVPFKDFRGNPHTQLVQFNLTEDQALEILSELQFVTKWYDSMGGPDSDIRELDTDSVVEFYKNFKEILLSAWGELSDDAMHFRKSGRYEFEESALFNATMMEFISNPAETTKLIDGIMPKGFKDVMKKAEESLDAMEKNASDSQAEAEIARLKAQVAALQSPESAS